MKKLAAIVLSCTLAVACVFSLAACSSDRAVDDTGQDSQQAIANPFTEYNTVEEAEAAAGFKIDIPDVVGDFENRTIRVLADGSNGNMIEVIYYPASQESYQASSQDSQSNTDLSSSNEIRIRKSAAAGDPSGDYTEYAQTAEADVKGRKVVMKGDAASDGSKVTLATWENEGYFYSLGAYTPEGLSAAEVEELVGEIQ